MFALSTPALPPSYSFTEVNQNWKLDSDFTGSLRITGKYCEWFPHIDLNGHKIIVNSEGIETGPETSAYLYGGILTSNTPVLKFRMMGVKWTKYSFIHIASVISDSSHKVGLQVTGEEGAVRLIGSRSNTFTGNVEVSKSRALLVLGKTSGAVAVRSNIIVKDQAMVRFENSNQLLKSSNVTLRKSGTLQTLSDSDITNTFQKLLIEENGVVYFNHTEGNSLNSKYYIYLDDLVINKNSRLKVEGWQEGRDFLLVRKTSANLADALTKISFSGYEPHNIHLKEFNSEYWSISAAPEPTTYGAILGTVGLCLWSWQKRRQTCTRLQLHGAGRGNRNRIRQFCKLL